MCLARYVGLPAHCFTINNHVVPEIFYDNAWHMYDADLIEYFPKADGSVASIQEIVDGVNKWKGQHPEYATINQANRYAYMAKPGWKSGPDILLRNPYYDDSGWLPSRVRLGRHHVAIRPDQQQLAVMLLDGLPRERAAPPGREAHAYWFNNGLHVNMDRGETPGSLQAKVGEGSLRHSPRWGRPRTGRIGNGTLEYDVPLASGEFRGGR